MSTKRCIQLQVYLSMFHRVKNILRHLLLFSVIESGNTFLDSHCKKLVLAIYYISPCIRSLPHVDMQSHHNYLVVSLTNYIQVYFCVVYFAYTNILFRAIIKNKKKKKCNLKRNNLCQYHTSLRSWYFSLQIRASAY